MWTARPGHNSLFSLPRGLVIWAPLVPERESGASELGKIANAP